MARSDGENNTDKVKEVFLSWTGSKLESGQISTIINAAWKKGGMEGHVLSTIFRKSAVTSVYQNHKEMKSELPISWNTKRVLRQGFTIFMRNKGHA